MIFLNMKGRIYLLLAGIILSVISASRCGVCGDLEYAEAPSDNPLRGLVPYVSASGKDQFPHSMEFCYFPLKDLMKGPDEFDWEPIEKTLDEVGGRGNQLIFRVYCEYPGREPALPAFLTDGGVRIIRWTNSQDGRISHTPEYENRLLRDALAAFIKALGDRYDGDPRVAFVTAGLLGSWGEWHNYPREDLWASKQVQREVMESYESAFTRTMVLLRYPAGTNKARYAGNDERPFGYHDDSFCWATIDTGMDGDSWYFEPSLAAAGASEKWMSFPIGGEIRPELWKQSFTDSRHPRDQGFVTCVESLHASWLMDSGLFNAGVPLDDQRRKTALKETARLGYEYYVSSAQWSDGVIRLTVENRGVAPFYYDWPVEIEVDGNVRATNWSLRGLLPGDQRTWSTQLASDSTLKIRVPNPMKGGKPLRFANVDQGDEWLVIKR